MRKFMEVFIDLLNRKEPYVEDMDYLEVYVNVIKETIELMEDFK